MAAKLLTSLHVIGVYAIVCRVNEKRYIGSSTVTIYSRWKHHRNGLKANRHCNPRLQTDWNEHGEAAFVVEILELCEQENCISREQFWMDFYSSAKEESGYNLSPTAVLSKEDALNLAAWIVALADDTDDFEKFDAMRDEALNS